MSETSIMEVTYVISTKIIKIYVVPAFKADNYFRLRSLSNIKKQLEYFFVNKLKQDHVSLKISYFDTTETQHWISEQQEYEEYIENCNNAIKLYVYAESDYIMKTMPEYNSTELVIHDDIRCNGCRVRPIVSFRYKCVQCPDYNLCGSCESEHKHPEHMMLRLLKMIYPGGRNNEIIIHDGVICNGCGTEPIIGYRYKCVECANYNLCQKCETLQEHSEHMMVRMSKHNRVAANESDSDDMKTVHDNVSCDICKCKPIVGYRYKCVNCAKFDLCQKCEAQKKHSGHILIRLLNNQNSAQYCKTTHDKIRCTSCWTNSIEGFRYMCLQCDDFDLCEKCEGRHKHSNHMMLRMPRKDYYTNPNIFKSLLAPIAEPDNSEDANEKMCSNSESSDHSPPPSYDVAVSQATVSSSPYTTEQLVDFQSEHMREVLSLMHRFNDLLSKSCNAVDVEKASSLFENIIQEQKMNSQSTQEKSKEK